MARNHRTGNYRTGALAWGLRPTSGARATLSGPLENGSEHGAIAPSLGRPTPGKFLFESS
jgi:hypothetical protein